MIWGRGALGPGAIGGGADSDDDDRDAEDDNDADGVRDDEASRLLGVPAVPAGAGRKPTARSGLCRPG